MSICTILQVLHLLPCLFTVIATFIIGTSFQVETISFSDAAFNVFFVVPCILFLLYIMRYLYSAIKYTSSAGKKKSLPLHSEISILLMHKKSVYNVIIICCLERASKQCHPEIEAAIRCNNAMKSVSWHCIDT